MFLRNFEYQRLKKCVNYCPYLSSQKMNCIFCFLNVKICTQIKTSYIKNVTCSSCLYISTYVYFHICIILYVTVINIHLSVQ